MPPRDAITPRQVLAFIGAIAFALIGAVYAYGALNNRVEVLESRMIEVRIEARDTSEKLNAIQRDIAIVQTNVQMQGRILEMVADKLGVPVIKGQ